MKIDLPASVASILVVIGTLLISFGVTHDRGWLVGVGSFVLVIGIRRTINAARAPEGGRDL